MRTLATRSRDLEARFHSLPTEAGSEQIVFTTPASRDLAPPGFYMAFAVSNLGQPSEAGWVRLQ